MDRGRIERYYKTTTSPEETIAYGKSLAQHLKPGNVLCLCGDLGAGKTTLIKGIVGALTTNDPAGVCSPTYSYLHIYTGATPVFHFDLYRLSDSEDFLQLGFEEYLMGHGICCIEWSERIEPLLPTHTQRLILKHAGADLRKIIYEVPKSTLFEECRSNQRPTFLR